MLTFRPRYLLLAVLLFATEVFIARYVHDRFIRPYGGDFLVVILMYCTLRAFVKISPLRAAIAVLLFAFTIEVLQHFRVVDRLGLTHNALARTVIGYGFDWLDLLAYVLGVATVLVLEKQTKNRR